MKPESLIKAAMNRQCVTGPAFGGGRMPAAFLQNMQFRIVMQVLPKLKIYRPKTKTTITNNQKL